MAPLSPLPYSSPRPRVIVPKILVLPHFCAQDAVLVERTESIMRRARASEAALARLEREGGAWRSSLVCEALTLGATGVACYAACHPSASAPRRWVLGCGALLVRTLTRSIRMLKHALCARLHAPCTCSL